MHKNRLEMRMEMPGGLSICLLLLIFNNLHNKRFFLCLFCKVFLDNNVTRTAKNKTPDTYSGVSSNLYTGVDFPRRSASVCKYRELILIFKILTDQFIHHLSNLDLSLPHLINHPLGLRRNTDGNLNAFLLLDCRFPTTSRS